MCGIAGCFQYKSSVGISKNMLERMISRLKHRGPDDYGFYINNNIGLAHSRLSIIDLNTGHQPIHNTDKSIWVVFNGEIFNYIELREWLEDKGYYFYTNTDTEVIVHLYEHYGIEFVKHLNGQFAIAIWDSNLNKLVLVRDRVGIVPLFYTEADDALFFASEIKAIIPALKSKPSLNYKAIDQLLTFWVPLSPMTLFEGIKEVSPGQILEIQNSKIVSSSYWDWVYPDDNNYWCKNENDLAEELRELLIDATRIRLRSDVPVGAYLSGGLDSSVLTSIIKNFSDTPLRTFSIEFEDKGLDESDYQRTLIKYLNTDHSHVICQSGTIVEQFQKAIWHSESIMLRSAPVPMSVLSNLVRESGYKVVLTGEGSDEVLGGYDIFKENKIRQFWAKNRSSNFRPYLLKKLYPYLDLPKSSANSYLKNFFGIGIDDPDIPYFSHLPRWDVTSKIKSFYSDSMKSALKVTDFADIECLLPANIKNWNSFNRSQYIESKTLMSGYLLSTQGDRMLMMNSVEGRFPFLDHRVIEFANKLDPRLKMKVLNEKFLLKKAMRNYVPKSIIERYKQPYRSPDISSFVGDNSRDYIHYLLSEDKLNEFGYFDSFKVNLLRKKISAGKAIGYKDNMAFMALLSTQSLHEQFINEF
ncbi:MAG: asparagine synthase (glutamine-hydrolyzing) [Gammaproteobacteria bacterium]|nr:asparagine synthase (glutamine-hydrolyzing) [Gammaproteobacteria bacterium]